MFIFNGGFCRWRSWRRSCWIRPRRWRDFALNWWDPVGPHSWVTTKTLHRYSCNAQTHLCLSLCICGDPQSYAVILGPRFWTWTWIKTWTLKPEPLWWLDSVSKTWPCFQVQVFATSSLLKNIPALQLLWRSGGFLIVKNRKIPNLETKVVYGA